MKIKDYSSHPVVIIHKISFLKEKIIDSLLKKKMDLSLSQYMVLLFCYLFPGESQQKLARSRDCTEASVSRTIKILMKKNFLEREDAVDDKRRKELKLTKTGERILNQAKGIVTKEFDLSLSVLTQKEKESLDNIFKKIWKHTVERSESLKIIKDKNHFKIKHKIYENK